MVAKAKVLELCLLAMFYLFLIRHYLG